MAALAGAFLFQSMLVETKLTYLHPQGLTSARATWSITRTTRRLPALSTVRRRAAPGLLSEADAGVCIPEQMPPWSDTTTFSKCLRGAEALHVVVNPDIVLTSLSWSPHRQSLVAKNDAFVHIRPLSNEYVVALSSARGPN